MYLVLYVYERREVAGTGDIMEYIHLPNGRYHPHNQKFIWKNDAPRLISHSSWPDITTASYHNNHVQGCCQETSPAYYPMGKKGIEEAKLKGK